MNEQVESGHADAQNTEDLTQAREQALAAHQNAVEKNADEPVVVTGDEDPDKSFADVENTNVEPSQDTRASAPVQAEAPQTVQPGSTPDMSVQSPDVSVETPDRHVSNTAYDEEGRDKTVDDADFNADEKSEEDANG